MSTAPPTHPDRIDRRDAAALAGIRNATELNHLVTHIRDFAAIMTDRHGHRLEEWITLIDEATPPGIAAFARNLRRDIDAVTATSDFAEMSAPDPTAASGRALPSSTR